MKEEKNVGENHEVRKYHYTVGQYLPSIVEEGEIRLAESSRRKKRFKAVWVSTNEFWEETANKSIRKANGRIVRGDRESTYCHGRGLARIKVKPESAPFNWPGYVRKSKVPGSMRRALVAVAKMDGADPKQWFVSYKPIKSKDWLSIDIFDWESQTWRTIPQSIVDGPGENDDVESGLGHCYENSYDAIMQSQINEIPFETLGLDREKVFLCHGTVEDPKGKIPRHGHAWLEYGEKVIDVSKDDRALETPKEVYYALGNVRDVRVYGHRDVSRLALKHFHKGPWE